MRRGKHLHGRGEDLIIIIHRAVIIETPPRAWRRRKAGWRNEYRDRNTSTGVEKTVSQGDELPAKWKHLHGRGED